MKNGDMKALCAAVKAAKTREEACEKAVDDARERMREANDELIAARSAAEEAERALKAAVPLGPGLVKALRACVDGASVFTGSIENTYMYKLERLGFVIGAREGYRRFAWNLTDAGRAKLAECEKREAADAT